MTTTSMPSDANLGPLTTAFTYPLSCAVVVRDCEDCDYGWQAQTCSDNRRNDQGVQDNPDCWPPREQSVSTGPVLWDWGFYSPGIECPVGYKTACVATGGVDGGFPFKFTLSRNETAIGCCPTGFECSWNPEEQAQTCNSVVSSGSFAVVQCSSGTSNGFTYLDIPATITETETRTRSKSTSTSKNTVTISEFTVEAPLFQLIHKSSDMQSRRTDTNPGPEQTSPPSGEGLSTGAKAGVGVGVSIGAIALIGAVIFFFLRRRRKPDVDSAPAEGPKPELSGGQNQHPVELQAASTVHEI